MPQGNNAVIKALDYILFITIMITNLFYRGIVSLYYIWLIEIGAIAHYMVVYFSSGLV